MAILHQRRHRYDSSHYVRINGRDNRVLRHQAKNTDLQNNAPLKTFHRSFYPSFKKKKKANNNALRINGKLSSHCAALLMRFKPRQTKEHEFMANYSKAPKTSCLGL